MITAAATIVREISHNQMKLCFWWSPKSTPDSPVRRKVEGVSGEIGKPTVIWPQIAALPIASPGMPAASEATAMTGSTA